MRELIPRDALVARRLAIAIVGRERGWWPHYVAEMALSLAEREDAPRCDEGWCRLLARMAPALARVTPECAPAYDQNRVARNR